MKNYMAKVKGGFFAGNGIGVIATTDPRMAYKFTEETDAANYGIPVVIAVSLEDSAWRKMLLHSDINRLSEEERAAWQRMTDSQSENDAAVDALVRRLFSDAVDIYEVYCNQLIVRRGQSLYESKEYVYLDQEKGLKKILPSQIGKPLVFRETYPNHYECCIPDLTPREIDLLKQDWRSTAYLP